MIRHMKRTAQILALSSALLASSIAAGEDLATIYTIALRNDPAIREAEANMNAQMETRPQARAALLPSLNASASWENFQQDGNQTLGFVGSPGTPGVTDLDTDQTSWSLSLDQALLDFAAWRTFRKSDEEVKKALVDYRAAEQDLIIRVTEAYFEVLAAQDTLAAERAAKEAIGRQLEQAERRFEVGLIAITDVKESQAAFDDAVALEIAARRALANSKEVLREITGEYTDVLAAPGEEFPLIPPEPQVEQDWVDVSLQQNLALESARVQTEITRADIGISRAGHLPTISLQGSYGNSESEGERFSASGATSSTQIIDNDLDNQAIGVNLSLPIFSGGRTSSEVQQKVFQHRASRENYERVVRETEREARDAYLGVIAEIARVRALSRSVESNQTALEATEAGYDVGTRTTVDVLNARDSLLRAETQYARSKYDYLINVLKLKLAAGTLSASDVSEINTWLEADEKLEEIPGRGGQPDAELPEGSVPSRIEPATD